MAFKSLSEMKKARSTSFTALVNEVEKVTQSFRRDDENYWSLGVDKAGNGSAIIRFLPAPPEEDVPWVRYWHHAFQGPTGKWYIENSLTTLNKSDPVSDLNSQLWNSGVESDKDIARAQKRKLTYVANILVVKDPANPQNEGKVFLYKFGKKIFDKIKEAMKPVPEYEGGPVPESINPFELWEGVNFRIKAKNVQGYRNYDSSRFESVGLDDEFAYVKTPVADSDAEIEAIWKQASSLQQFVSPDKFRTYEELTRRLNDVLMKREVLAEPKKPVVSESEEDEAEETPARSPKAAPVKKDKAPAKKPEKKEELGEPEDEEFGIDYFRKLAESDE